MHSMMDSKNLNEKYLEVCKKIEADPNYQPNMDDKALLDLVYDPTTGNPKFQPQKHALAISPFSINTDRGKVYLIRQTHLDNPELTYFYLLVDKTTGRTSFHTYEQVVTGKFTLGSFPFLLLDHFLNKESLIPTSPHINKP